MSVFQGRTGRSPDHMAVVNLRSMMAHLLMAQARIAPKVILPQASKSTNVNYCMKSQLI